MHRGRHSFHDIEPVGDQLRGLVGVVGEQREPDYVVLGETRTYSFESITRAIRLIASGARFIATNPDATGPTPDGPLPATGSVAALISLSLIHI